MSLRNPWKTQDEKNPFTLFKQTAPNCGVSDTQTTVTVKCNDFLTPNTYGDDSTTVTIESPTSSQKST